MISPNMQIILDIIHRAYAPELRIRERILGRELTTNELLELAKDEIAHVLAMNSMGRLTNKPNKIPDSLLVALHVKNFIP